MPVEIERKGNIVFAVVARGSKMAIESLVALGLATAFLAGLAWYDSRQRSKGKDSK